MNNKYYISACDVAENAKLNHEIAEELRRYKINHQLSCQCPTLASRSNKDSLTTWILRSSWSMTRIFCLPLFTLLPTLAQAETCTPTPDCKSLGYTETSCPDGGGVKCPWNTSLLYCGENGKKICADMGHPYPCTGANEIPSGKACTNKYYTTCTCASGYEWKNGKCEKEPPKNGLINGLYYCDNVVKGIQVGSEKLIIALNDQGNIDLNSARSQCNQYSFCGDTNGEVPTENQLIAIYNNINTVQNRLSSNGGTPLSSVLYWSSTFYSNVGRVGYWAINPIDNKTSIMHFSSQNYVRCITSF